jgi:hypothetical protein
MRSTTLIRKIYRAFAGRRYPGHHDIVHCEYDRRWGGSLNGPCRECAEVVAAFRGKGNRGLRVEGLSDVSFGLVPLSEAAFPFWLPSYLAAGIRTTECGWNLFEGLQFRFRSPQDDKEAQWQVSRLALLSGAELEALIAAFEHMERQGKFSEDTAAAIVGNLSRWRRSLAP